MYDTQTSVHEKFLFVDVSIDNKIAIIDTNRLEIIKHIPTGNLQLCLV